MLFRKKICLLCVVTCLLLFSSGCNGADVQTYYANTDKTFTSDGSVDYRMLTGEESINWFPQCIDKILMGYYKQEGTKYSVYRMKTDEQAAFLTFKGGFDVGVPPRVRTDIQLPDLENDLPAFLRPVNTSGEFDITDTTSIAAIMGKLKYSSASDNQFEMNPSQGYGFLCFYNDFPFIARLIYIQPNEGGTFIVQTQTWTNENEITCELISDDDKRILSEIFEKLNNAEIQRNFTIGKGKNNSVSTWQRQETQETYTYDAAGNMTQKSVNDLAISMTYNAANELKTMQSENGKIDYSYDQNGNLTQKELDGKKDTYTYDTLNRLTSYVGYDGYAQNYTYNAQSMMSAKESKGNPTRQTMEEIVSGKKEEPSADGDDPGPAEWVKTSYTYDVTAPYYEALSETTDGVTTAYEYGVERISVYEKIGWSTLQTDYVYDGRGSVAQELTYNSSWYTFGGVLAKKAVASYSYTPFGEILENNNTSKTINYAYIGESYDSATGMVNLRARWYEPATMRFSQRDIWHGAQIIATTQNRYLYCIDDPINLYDYSGKVITGNNAGVRLPISKPLVDLTKDKPELRKSVADSISKLSALISTGIDTTGYNDAQKKVVEEAERELLGKAINGTLTSSERSKIIQRACNKAQLYDGGFHISGDSLYYDGKRYLLTDPNCYNPKWETIKEKSFSDVNFNWIDAFTGAAFGSYDDDNAKYIKSVGFNATIFVESFVSEGFYSNDLKVTLLEGEKKNSAIVLIGNAETRLLYQDVTPNWVYSAWLSESGLGSVMVSEAAKEEYYNITNKKAGPFEIFDYEITYDEKHKDDIYYAFIVSESDNNLTAQAIVYPNDQLILGERVGLGSVFIPKLDLTDSLGKEYIIPDGKDLYEDLIIEKGGLQ